MKEVNPESAHSEASRTSCKRSGSVNFPSQRVSIEKIRAELRGVDNMIGNDDLWLAAHTRADSWIMVTHNEREFIRVPGLQVKNWAAS